MAESEDQTRVADALTELQRLLDAGDLGRARAGAEALLAFQSTNTQASAVLKEIERRESILGLGAAPALQISQVKCRSCGQVLELQSEKTRGVACSCGAIFDATDPKAPIRRSKIKPPRSFIKLGLVGTFSGKRYQVIGRVSYQATIREWEPEDRVYEKDTWYFDEWILVGEKKDYLYISEDSEGYVLSTPFVPDNPDVPSDKDRYMNLSGRSSIRILEHGRAKALGFEGEFTWMPEISEIVHYAEGDGPSGIECVEWRGSPGNIQEVEFFKGRKLSRKELAQAFSLAEELARIKKEEAAALAAKAWATVAGLLAVFLLAMATKNAFTPSRLIFNQSGILQSAATDEGVMLGPIHLATKGSIHELKLQVEIPDNRDIFAGVELLDGEGETINEVAHDFWRESGVDDEGRWSESDLSESRLFRLENPGVYYARVTVEQPQMTGIFKVHVYDEVALARYYLVAGVLLLGYAVAVWRMHHLNPLLAIVGLILIAFLIAKYMPDDDD